MAQRGRARSRIVDNHNILDLLMESETEDIDGDIEVSDSDSECSDESLETVSDVESSGDQDNQTRPNSRGRAPTRGGPTGDQAGRGRGRGRDRSHFDEWKWDMTSANTFISKINFTGNPGIKRQVSLQLGDSPTQFQAYRTFFPECFWQSISTETNRYAAECILKKPDESWFDTTANEIEAYFALSVLMSQVKKNTLRSYWSSRPLTATPFFAETMPRNRFYSISRYLHLVNNQTRDKVDRISKLRPIVEFFNKKFADVYKSEECMALDESLMKCRGRLSYIQFNPNKRARFGIKFYKLCESISGYCFCFEIYTGKKVGALDIPIAEAIVLQMMAPYEAEGHTLYLDNWYSAPNLFTRLQDKGTNVVGTVRTNRKHMPKEFRNTKNLKRGDSRARFSHKMMTLQWMDKKPVTMLTTMHDNVGMTKTGKVRRSDNVDIEKPKSVIEYNQGMGGVDRQDQQLASFPIMRRYLKVYKKIFFYILDMALYNSYVIYLKITKRKMCFDEYRLNVVEQVLENITLPEYRRRGRPSLGVTPLRLQGSSGGHFPRHIPPNAVKQNPSRQCKVCSERKKKSESRWECKSCGVALHLPDCFEVYHTKLSLK